MNGDRMTEIKHKTTFVVLIALLLIPESRFS